MRKNMGLPVWPCASQCLPLSASTCVSVKWNGGGCPSLPYLKNNCENQKGRRIGGSWLIYFICAISRQWCRAQWRKSPTEQAVEPPPRPLEAHSFLPSLSAWASLVSIFHSPQSMKGELLNKASNSLPSHTHTPRDFLVGLEIELIWPPHL